jgi:NADH dehydrogenase
MTKVIIVGGGFAGVSAINKLKKANVDILLLDKANHHVFQPLLYQVATASLPACNISASFREIFYKQSNVAVLMTNVENIELDKQRIQTEDNQFFNYDYLILAPGSRHSYFGNPDWEEYAPGLKTNMDAANIRDRILMAFENGEKMENSEAAKRYLNFAIIGAGPTGVEIAGSIAEFVHHTLARNFRHIQPEQSKIYLIEGANQVLPSYPKKLAEKALLYLEQLGVTVWLNTMVTNVTSERLYMGEKSLDVPTIIWAAGNQASPLLKTLHHPLDAQGRVLVNRDLSIKGHPNVFVVGDAASLKDKNGQTLPALAPVAIQEARYVANIIKKNLSAENRKPFTYFDKGVVATIGRGKAVLVLKKISFSGFTAWLIWAFIHIFYMISFKNRLFVMLQWIYLYLIGSRANRIIESFKQK